MKPSDVAVGTLLPERIEGPITRATLALYAGASWDHIPLHIDTDAAQRAGWPDVFVHGMLTMAYMGQLLTRRFHQQQLREWRVRFTAVTPVHATITCGGEVTELFVSDAGERLARVRIHARIDDGTETAVGEAVVAIETKPNQ